MRIVVTVQSLLTAEFVNFCNNVSLFNQFSPAKVGPNAIPLGKVSNSVEM